MSGFRFRCAAHVRGAVAALALLAVGAGGAHAQSPAGDALRPIPYPMKSSDAFLAAVEAGSRTLDGVPGPEYWQQTVGYAIDARVDPDAKSVDGTTRITYRNHAPSRPSVLRIRLNQNLHAEGSPRQNVMEVTGGFDIRSVATDGIEAAVADSGRPRYQVNGTLMFVWLPEPLETGDSAVVELSWSFRIPQAGANGRMGWNEDNLIYLGYWYPQVAVFDDVIGWQNDPFLGRAEFHANHADYDVRITTPEGWLVIGTGELQNESEVFPEAVIERIRLAERSDEVVHVLTEEDFGPGTATLGSGTGELTWHYTADRVRDVAYSLTRASMWDAARTPVGDRDGDGSTDYARVDALYRASAPGWVKAAEYAQHSIAFFSEYLDHPYPWSHMSAVEGAGIIGGGMEFPMMTLIGGYVGQPESALYGVVAHELGHMWFPMIVNSDEIRWAWMDEGLTVFNTTQAMADYFPDTDPESQAIQGYVGAVSAGFDGTMMQWTDWAYPNAWGIAAYPKPAVAMLALREIVGEAAFLNAYRGYLDTWAYRHPKPEDYFHWFDAALGRDLGWFWRSFYYEQWDLDHAVASVETDGNRTRITIQDRGELPLPVHVEVARADGSVERAEVPVETWLSGAREHTIEVAASPAVTGVRLDPNGRYPDRNRANDTWEADS